jgi:hypothetical protein
MGSDGCTGCSVGHVILEQMALAVTIVSVS